MSPIELRSRQWSHKFEQIKYGVPYWIIIYQTVGWYYSASLQYTSLIKLLRLDIRTLVKLLRFFHIQSLRKQCFELFRNFSLLLPRGMPIETRYLLAWLQSVHVDIISFPRSEPNVLNWKQHHAKHLDRDLCPIPCYGVKITSTNRVDTIAKLGILFSRWYLCVPCGTY